MSHACGIACLPSLLTIWMNGQLFDLDWRRGRDLWTDAEMRARAAAYVGTVARHLRDRPNVVAYDLGDELLGDHHRLPLQRTATQYCPSRNGSQQSLH